MPDLLQLYKNQAKVAEHIAAEGSKDAVEKVSLFLLMHMPTLEASCVITGVLLLTDSTAAVDQVHDTVKFAHDRGSSGGCRLSLSGSRTMAKLQLMDE